MHIAIRGAVQGVGFRPFVYRLASEMKLPGWVLNSPQGVFIEVEGEADALKSFLLRLQHEKPSPSFIQSLEFSFLDPVPFGSFEIRTSDQSRDSRRADPPRHCHLRRMPVGSTRSVQSALPLSLHQLHSLRPPVHDHGIASLRPPQHIDEIVRNVRGMPE